MQPPRRVHAVAACSERQCFSVSTMDPQWREKWRPEVAVAKGNRVEVWARSTTSLSWWRPPMTWSASWRWP